MTKPLSDTALVFQVFNEVGIINQLSSAQFGRVLGPLGLGQSEFGVLNHFVRVGDGTTPSRLASNFQMSKPSMTAILGKLQAKGLVEITGSEEDRRKKIVTITEAGRRARQHAVEAVAPLGAQVLQACDREQLRAILPILVELRQYLDAAREGEDGLQH